MSVPQPSPDQSTAQRTNPFLGNAHAPKRQKQDPIQLHLDQQLLQENLRLQRELVYLKLWIDEQTVSQLDDDSSIDCPTSVGDSRAEPKASQRGTQSEPNSIPEEISNLQVLGLQAGLPSRKPWDTWRQAPLIGLLQADPARCKDAIGCNWEEFEALVQEFAPLISSWRVGEFSQLEGRWSQHKSGRPSVHPSDMILFVTLLRCKTGFTESLIASVLPPLHQRDVVHFLLQTLHACSPKLRAELALPASASPQELGEAMRRWNAENFIGFTGAVDTSHTHPHPHPHPTYSPQLQHNNNATSPTFPVQDLATSRPTTTVETNPTPTATNFGQPDPPNPLLQPTLPAPTEPSLLLATATAQPRHNPPAPPSPTRPSLCWSTLVKPDGVLLYLSEPAWNLSPPGEVHFPSQLFVQEPTICGHNARMHHRHPAKSSPAPPPPPPPPPPPAPSASPSSPPLEPSPQITGERTALDHAYIELKSWAVLTELPMRGTEDYKKATLGLLLDFLIPLTNRRLKALAEQRAGEVAVVDSP